MQLQLHDAVIKFLLSIIGYNRVIVRRKCVKASEKKKQRDLLLTKLVLKTDEIERGMNFDGDGESAKG